ncbi:ATP-grasp domain-containing protein [Aeromicrobium sp. CF3.5]|uniref:ATP-grasp domain-containing protein n=1 Tax=Aeromicrobium sp. CF3.5 TaxID=3373078 RepID=UPI003EE6AC18
MTTNVFVLGLDDLNLETLHHLPAEYAIHQLLPKDELVGTDEIDLAGLLERAQATLEAFDGTIDAVVGYWDFPVSSMVPILCQQFGLHGPNLEAVATCEHKYWSRVEQSKVIDDVPGFAILDLDKDDGLPPELSYPVWVKPVKSASSELAFRVEDDVELKTALDEMRGGIGKFGEPFEFVLDRVDLPAEIAEVGATACLAEEAVGGRQITVEGYSTRGDVHVYGIIDSLVYPETSSFLRYQYPAQLPASVSERLIESSVKVIEQIGLTWTTFNIEYFWDPDTDRLRLLEVNPRHSQSHAKMFEYVDGVSNHEVLVELATGHEPSTMRGAGEHDVAAKWFMRAFGDGVVTRSPGPDDIARIEQELPGVTVHPMVGKGDRLSDQSQQDSYSFELAQIFMGAHDEDELTRIYRRCVEMLGYEIDGKVFDV